MSRALSRFLLRTRILSVAFLCSFPFGDSGKYDRLQYEWTHEALITQEAERTFPATASPFSGEMCDIYEYPVIETVIFEENQYDSWRSCCSDLKAANQLVSQRIRIRLREIHANEQGVDHDD